MLASVARRHIAQTECEPLQQWSAMRHAAHPTECGDSTYYIALNNSGTDFTAKQSDVGS
jgi:hypothetical protein